MKRKSVQKISQKFLKIFKMIPFFVISAKRSEDEYVKIKSVEQVLWPNVPILLYVVFVSVVVILWKICIILTSTLFSDYFKSHSDKLTKSNSSNSQCSKYGRNSTQINESIFFMKFSKLALKNCEFNFSKIEKFHILVRF